MKTHGCPSVACIYSHLRCCRPNTSNTCLELPNTFVESLCQGSLVSPLSEPLRSVIEAAPSERQKKPNKQQMIEHALRGGV